MNPIRILNVVTKMDAAGIETLLMNFYRNIDKNIIQFDFLTHRSEKGFYDDEILKLGGRIYSVPPINPLKHKKYLHSLDSFFMNHNEYKIVHSHINTFSMYPLRAAMKAGVPIRIAHSHISNVPFDFKSPFRIYTKLKLKKFSTYNFACSKIAGSWLYGKKAITKSNFEIINNSINASLYEYNEDVENKMKNSMNLNGKFVIGHIGRFNTQKNHAFILDVFKIINNENKNTVLILIGDGELRNFIEKKVYDLELTESVVFTGIKSNVHELIQVMDLFIFPSLYEGLGIVAIEAQAAGVKCIVSERIPREAFITDLIQALPLNKGAEAFAQFALKNLYYEKRNTFNEIKDAGYDIKTQVKKLEDFYKSVYPVKCAQFSIPAENRSTTGMASDGGVGLDVP